MQLVKGLFIAAVLCVAQVSAGSSEQQQKPEVESNSASSASDSSESAPSQVQKGFDVHQVKFTSSDPKEEGGEEEEKTSMVPLMAAIGACACIGVLGAVYMKRRNEEEKLPGEIFTIDDKNSVL
ncbi:hypothetical protein PRIC1_007937 [Phytophthora ramorum]|uniref:RxLR effector protein n=1 Tax=Phytophthora ramorum TaxID=164328 RepID=H3GL02_PHYRM|nr:hypothetical protein KRP23_1915 [Phytophthora ramorum]KAH7502777.1 hypothetical protein KRP22_8238 [Phytophthora ramorum]